MNDNGSNASLGLLIGFLEKLEASKLHYDLKHVRDSVMVVTYLPAGTWDIEFMQDGTLEAEFFRRDEGPKTVTPEWLDQFIEDNKD